MSTTTEPLERRLAELAVDAITDKYCVGESSRFCDDAPDWFEAEREELIKLVLESWEVRNVWHVTAAFDKDGKPMDPAEALKQMGESLSAPAPQRLE